ncbi:hypothetical protein M1437_03790, partial [Patescibacteria group bacterium]|nr:hypothetical protein [Patescibacteria group bacterium]
GFAPILIVVLIAVIIGGYLVYSGKINLNKSQTTNNPITQNLPSTTVRDETTNWKTYENSLSKYTLKYPSEWGFRDVDIKLFSKEDQKVLISYTAFGEVYQEKDNPYVWKGIETVRSAGEPLLIVKKTEGKTLQQITEDFKKSVVKGRGNVKRSEVKTIDGTEGVLIVTSTEFADPKASYFHYYFIKNQQFYEYSYLSRDESPVLIPETILSTFKFTQ